MNTVLARDAEAAVVRAGSVALARRAARRRGHPRSRSRGRPAGPRRWRSPPRAAGTAVLWATQRIEELAGFADRVTVLDRGVVCFADTVAALAAAGGGDRHVIGLGPRTTAALPALDAALGSLGRLQPGTDAGHAADRALARRLARRRALRADRRRRRRDELSRRAAGDGARLPRRDRGARGVSVLVAEARKVPAFLRRDLLTLLSYRAAFVGDLLAIAVPAVMFGFFAKLVEPSALPTYNGVATGYFEFVMIGVIIATVSGLLLAEGLDGDPPGAADGHARGAARHPDVADHRADRVRGVRPPVRPGPHGGAAARRLAHGSGSTSSPAASCPASCS